MKNLNILGGLWEKLTNTLSTTRMRGCLCEICKREVGNFRNVRQREVGGSHQNTLCVPSYCAGQVRGGDF